jgi:hypothetical protein
VCRFHAAPPYCYRESSCQIGHYYPSPSKRVTRTCSEGVSGSAAHGYGNACQPQASELHLPAASRREDLPDRRCPLLFLIGSDRLLMMVRRLVADTEVRDRLRSLVAEQRQRKLPTRAQRLGTRKCFYRESLQQNQVHPNDGNTNRKKSTGQCRSTARGDFMGWLDGAAWGWGG